tara:strand:- start:480 stop:677 length:198 start_codon:yes stop_codon:yes gene_type:complete
LGNAYERKEEFKFTMNFQWGKIFRDFMKREIGIDKRCKFKGLGDTDLVLCTLTPSLKNPDTTLTP